MKIVGTDIELNKVYNCDCIEFMKKLPDKCIDLVLTDPPYGISFNDGDFCQKWEKILGVGEEQEGRPILQDKPEEYIGLMEKFLPEVNRILKKDGCCCCCCGGGPRPQFAHLTLLMDKYLKFKQAVVWDKNLLGIGWHYRRSYEFIMVAEKKNGSCKWFGGHSQKNIIQGITGIIPQKDEHPCQKPVELMGKFINLHTDKTATVFDPFMGSGTTILAAERLNRNWLGCEISAEYCKIAEERIERERSQLKLFPAKSGE